jgi:enamine deaminase RidA (YjgF/YER057c/UK114 family)
MIVTDPERASCPPVCSPRSAGAAPFLGAAVVRHASTAATQPAPATLLGVAALFDPDALIEIEVIAARAPL